jgi:hypothetical protein
MKANLRKSYAEEGLFVHLISGKEAEQVAPNGLSRVDRDPPDNACVGNRAFGGKGTGIARQTARDLTGGE